MRFLLLLPVLCAVAAISLACGPSAQTCNEPLSSFDCPSTYDTAVATPCPSGQLGDVTAGTCGSLLAYQSVLGAGAATCFYDPGTKALVGASYQDDTPDLCNGSSVALAGQTDLSCMIAHPDVTATCNGRPSDAGGGG